MADTQQYASNGENNAASQQVALACCTREGHCKYAVALRRTAFLDVSSLNFGGAKSTAVFLPAVLQEDIVRPVPAGNSRPSGDSRMRQASQRPNAGAASARPGVWGKASTAD